MVAIHPRQNVPQRVGAPAPINNTIADFDRRAAALKKRPEFKRMSARARKKTLQILKKARKRSNRGYYMKKLELVFDTPEAPPTNTRKRTEKRYKRSIGTAAPKDPGLEERMTRGKRKWTTLRGVGGKTYKVDRGDPACIVVKVKVRLVGPDAARMKKLEDRAEKKAQTKGYVLDIEFVDKDGPDVFEVGADFGKWPTSGNIVGSARTVAHEVHHLLKLDDRYDYIESHAGNRHMKRETRIHWFLVQMGKPADPLGKKSIMGGPGKPLHDDVCEVAQSPDEKHCIRERKRLLGGD